MAAITIQTITTTSVPKTHVVVLIQAYENRNVAAWVCHASPEADDLSHSMPEYTGRYLT